MPALRVALFGRFSVICGDKELTGLEDSKVQELFCYLLLHRGRSHTREMLAELLWADSTASQSKKYLRQTLWQLQACLEKEADIPDGPLVLLDAGWLSLNPETELWIDAAALEAAYQTVEGVPGRELTTDGAQVLAETVELYRGNLLEGWYQDWCIFERERFANMHLAMLDKLMDFCEATGAYETGLLYGTRILREDQARERTHRRMMRLYYLAGNRVAALRQYKGCVETLRTELDVAPSRRTVALYDQVREDRLDPDPTGEEVLPSPDILWYLRDILAILRDLQKKVDQAGPPHS
jgi:DNA-binding SARP family transcriptional activator